MILAKAQPLILDGSTQVRQQLLKLLKCLPAHELGPIDQLLLYVRAGMAHLSSDIRISSLDVLDWMLDTNGPAVVSYAGGWIKTLRTFQNLLSWQSPSNSNGAHANSKWSSTRSTSNLGGSKLLVHQLTTLSRFLTVGLIKPSVELERKAASERAVELYPFWHTDSHMLPKKSRPFGYLNLFGAARDVESEVYEDAEQRAEVFVELGLDATFSRGVKEAKKEAGEVGRAAALVDRALKLVNAT